MYRCIIALFALATLVGCNNKPAPRPETSGGQPASVSEPASAPRAATSVEVEQKLQELAGNGATQCGQVQSMANEEIRKASDCAMSAAKAKKPFLVSYAMPGLTIGIAGSAAGKLFTVQGVQQKGQESAPKFEPCPAPLRVAESGRVTCFAPGSMGMTPGAGNPHGGASPHGGMDMPPAGTPNPHQPGPKTSH